MGRLFTFGGMSIGAVTNIVLGIGFAYSAMTSPRPNVGFIVCAAVLTPIGFLMLMATIATARRGAEMDRLRATGIPGQAQILAMTQTGMYVNKQPVVSLQLQVQTGMHPPYTVTRREIVPMIALGRLTNGQPLQVKVDQANPTNLVILW